MDDFRKGLFAAARIVDEEASTHDEEAAEFYTDARRDGPMDEDDHRRVDMSRGRATSLRDLARKIREAPDL